MAEPMTGPMLKPGGKALLFVIVVGLFLLAFHNFRAEILPKAANDKHQHRFDTDAPRKVRAESAPPLIVKTIKIKFDTGSAVLDPTYDPSIPSAIKEIGQLVGRLDAARIIIEGNCDTSLKDYYLDPEEQKLHAEALKALSEARAKAVAQALIKEFKLDTEMVIVRGNGWDNPAVPNAMSAADHAENRRVEVKILRLEGR